MNYGNIIVEQIDCNGNIIMDKDISYSRNEIKEIIKEHFNIIGEDMKYLIGEYHGKKFAIYAKNITYLGNPHPLYKKRVQLGDNFIKCYKYFYEKNIDVLILGVYRYKNNTLFVSFDKENYVKNKSHNSSAHILMSDLEKAFEKGYFSKIDIRSNKLIVFNKENIKKFLDIRFDKYKDPKFDLFNELDDFFNTLDIEWTGIDCYEEMIENNFSQKFQPEWPGFYLEFKLASYLHKQDTKSSIQYVRNKKQGEIDLDLYFPEIPAYGDLKCHSIGTSSIPGNDYETIFKVIKNYSIYYVVCEHETIKDKELGYVTTRFWNMKKKKKTLMSYSKRMKGKVYLRSYMVLEINKYNARYLSDFQKDFINSDGNLRKSKIMIKNKDLSNFVVYKHDL